MPMTVSETADLTVSEFHDIPATDITTAYIEVRRRNEPGAGAFAGVQLLSGTEHISAFDTRDAALAFIDALHEHGLPDAIRYQAREDLDDTQIVEMLKFTPDTLAASEYIQKTGCSDPFNLDITIHVETMVTTSEEAPVTTADSTTATQPAATSDN